MNVFTKVALVALSVSAFSCVAQADEGQMYVGIKAGSFMVDLDGADDPTPFGVQLGYDFGQNLSLEFEYNTGSADYSVLGTTVDMDVTTMAAYGTFRSEGKGYFLVKLGLIKEEIEASTSLISVSEDDTGLSYGFGGGIRLADKFALEAEYTIVEQDVDYLGLTARVLF